MSSPRYALRPSPVTRGLWVVLDTQEDRVARRTNGRPAIFLQRELAEEVTARLNRESVRRAICPSCRRKRLASTIEAGECEECRKH